MSKWWVEGMQIKSETGPVCLLNPHNHETCGPLIATAPELLDALEQTMLLFLLIDPPLDQKTTDAFNSLIAKAKGKSS